MNGYEFRKRKYKKEINYQNPDMDVVKYQSKCRSNDVVLSISGAIYTEQILIEAIHQKKKIFIEAVFFHTEKKREKD